MSQKEYVIKFDKHEFNTTIQGSLEDAMKIAELHILFDMCKHVDILEPNRVFYDKIVAWTIYEEGFNYNDDSVLFEFGDYYIKGWYLD